MRRICVFCGSSPGARPAYGEATAELARVLVAEGLGLVYGGANVGLMATLADTALAEGGEVIGVIPRALVEKEIAHNGLSDLRVVGSMHERKAKMTELCDAFVAYDTYPHVDMRERGAEAANLLAQGRPALVPATPADRARALESYLG